MGAAQFFSAMARKAMVGQIGIPFVLLLAPSHMIRGQQHPAVDELLQQFESSSVFTQQYLVAKAIVATNDRSVLPELEPWLTHNDRCLRGNAAYIFGRFGDPRGLAVIASILGDRSANREIHEISSAGGPSLYLQIRQDRYYAAHLLGDLKDPRAIPILVSLLTDPDVNYIVPWSLGQIGDRSAIEPLIQTLSDPNPSMRVLAVYALIELKATKALPRLRQLLDDNARSNFGKLESVADAAQAAILRLQSETAR